MIDKIQLFIGYIAFPFIIINIMIIVYAWFVSRILFNGRLKKFHFIFWTKLVNEEPSAPNLLHFDKTKGLRNFRLNSAEYFQDRKLFHYRKASIISLKTGLVMFVLLIILVPLCLILIKIIK